MDSSEAAAALSERERQILRLLAAGLSNDEIASTDLLLKAVMVCDSFDNVGIPALLTYKVIENTPEAKYRLCDEFKVLVPAEFCEQASVLLDANPIWA